MRRARGRAGRVRDAVTARGLAYGLGAGITFGLAAPLAKRLVADVPPLPLAALLYLGAAAGLTIVGLGRGAAGVGREAGIRRTDLATLAAMVVVGGLIGPLLMLVGLRHVSGVAGALLLNLEAPFTMVLAVVAFGEHLGARTAMGAALVVMGATLLGLGPEAVRADVAGVATIAGACLAWAVDNNLSARLALRDPVAVARWKTMGAGLVGLVLSGVLGHGPPPVSVVFAALAVGFVGYGLSIVWAVRAMRELGAARQAAFFAVAPFAGALGAVPLLGEALGRRELLVGILMAAGIMLLGRDEHGHWHEHEPLTHEHRHLHDEHHAHAHDPPVGPGEAHSHVHTHARLAHDHPHLSDAHHRHRH